MRHAKIERIVAVIVGAGLLLVLGCGLLAGVVQQRIVALPDIAVELGPLGLRTRAPHSSVCPEKTDPLANVCDRFSAIPQPAYYRVLLFWNSAERGARSGHVLGAWAFRLRDEARD